MNITLINSPEYTVNFSRFLPKAAKKDDLKLDQKIYTFALEVIRFAGVVISSTFKAAYLTTKYSATSFIHLVCDSFGITDFYLAAFKVAYWAFGLGFTFIATTGRFVITAYSSSNELYLGRFIQKGVDPRHIQTKGLKLDASKVPSNIKLEDLLTLFDRINFTNRGAPGYMHERARQGISTGDLRKQLEKFVNNVNDRVAFVGTPPSYDIIRLNRFYQQIEDAVRLSLYKVTQDLEKFLEANPQTDRFQEAEKRQHKNLLENQARLVIDLAIAGNYCGARFMGEAMSSYFHLHGNGDKLSGTLEETLIDLLAAKRNEVAREQIATHLGAGTHAFSQYMQNMGELLAIPGTENVIEHLSGTFDTAHYLPLFFQAYNEDTIIDSIQEKIRNSGTFREQIIDWIKEQVGEWKPENCPEPQELVVELQSIISQEDIDPFPIEQDVKLLIDLVNDLKEKQVEDFPTLEGGWNNFITELFALDESKEWFRGRFPTEKVLGDRIRKKQALQEKFSTGLLGKFLEGQYRQNSAIVLDEPAIETLKLFAVIQKLKDRISKKAGVFIDEETLMRILRGQTDLEAVIKDRLKQSFQTEFLEALNLEDMESRGISPEIMEWILVYHQIFIPKDIYTADLTEITLDRDSAAAYVSIVDPRRRRDADPASILHSEYSPARSKRYTFPAETPIEEVRNQIFETTFEKNTEAVILAAERILPTKAPFYSRWKNIVYIKTPEIGAAIFRNRPLRWIIAAYFLFKLVKISGQSYKQTSIWANRAYSYLTKDAPTQVKATYRIAYRTYSWIVTNRWKLFFYGMFAQMILSRVPHPFARRLARKIKPSAIFGNGGNGYLGIVLGLAINTLTFGWNASNQVSSTLQSIANRSKEERVGISKKYCYSIWNKAVRA